MCGIVGAIAQHNIVSTVIEGLQLLEYRGYDSAGLGYLCADTHTLNCIKTVGKVRSLRQDTQVSSLVAYNAIAHTRWATHGKPSKDNTHPQCSHEIAIVHNGIIENFHTLADELKQAHYVFASQTDSEVIAHLMHYEYQQDNNLLAAARRCMQKLQGSYAVAVIHQAMPDQILLFCRHSPLVIGMGNQATLFASDQLALIKHCNQFIYLKNEQLAICDAQQTTVFDAKGTIIEPKIHTLNFTHNATLSTDHPHFMLKEIHEQPKIIQNQLDTAFDREHIRPDFLKNIGLATLTQHIKHIHIVACGSSYHAALIGQQWLEQFTTIPCYVEVASEYRYRQIAVPHDTLLITLSQSGETADTLAALRHAKSSPHILATLAISNVANSTLVRESDLHIITLAEREIGVASTKAFTAQILALLSLALAIGNTSKEQKSIGLQLHSLGQAMEDILIQSPAIKQLAQRLTTTKQSIFIGRGLCYPMAKEGALKLKEISYIHAEAYPAGELKHGPLALVEPDLPIIALVANDPLFEKLQSNLNEIITRNGELIVLTESLKPLQLGEQVTTLHFPSLHPALSPFIFTIPLQLLAYYTAALKGHDVDQPRNLAKCVTVE